MTLAQAWESAADRLPPEITALLQTGKHPAFANAELLLALPELQVKLPGGTRPTQTDLFALLRGDTGLVACAIEGKVDEPFGPTIAAKRLAGAADRIAYLHDLLKLAPERSAALRYQLFHRTAAAILLARQFFATAAVLIVHSFSPTHRWFDDFEAFARELGVSPERGRLYGVGERGGVQLFVGWAVGDQKFRSDVTTITIPA